MHRAAARGPAARGMAALRGAYNSLLGARYRRDFAQPQWRGEQPIGRPHRSCCMPSGAGDTFQFVRYVPLVAALGATVVLEVYPGFRPAMAGLAGVATVIERGEALPDFDLHCPLLSLPLAFGTGLDSIPADVPYLAPLPERVAAWRMRLGPRRGKRVGVVFSGNPVHPDDEQRSIPLVQFARLLTAAPDRDIHILQNAIRDADRFALELLPHVRDHSAAISDFADTAALVSLMDVVVTVDTAVAHLAGALGWPVWVTAAAPAGLALDAGARRQPMVPDDVAVPADPETRLGERVWRPWHDGLMRRWDRNWCVTMPADVAKNVHLVAYRVRCAGLAVAIHPERRSSLRRSIAAQRRLHRPHRRQRDRAAPDHLAADAGQPALAVRRLGRPQLDHLGVGVQRHRLEPPPARA